jgi:hypothetical protein
VISLHLNISNPWSNRFEPIGCYFGNTLFEHKCWEVELNKNNDIVGITLRITTKQSHAGIFLAISILGFEAIFNCYDTRHWNDQDNCWEKS